MAAPDDKIPCLPTYTGHNWDREGWNCIFGSCETLTDVIPFAEPLLASHPEAKIIFVRRDFDSQEKNSLNTLDLASSDSLLAQPFPRLSESRVFRDEFKGFHKAMLVGGLLKIFSSAAASGGVIAGGIWFARWSDLCD